MPDEVGTEATRSDAPSADESLFGEAPDDRAAPVVQEEDSNDAAPDEPDGGGETAQEEQGTGDADEQATGGETEASEDLKVVLSIKGGRATIGVQQPSSDPHIEMFNDGDLTGLTQETLAVVERARARWEDNPKHPAHVRPDPPAGRRGGQRAAQDATGTAEESPAQQQTLRLF